MIAAVAALVVGMVWIFAVPVFIQEVIYPVDPDNQALKSTVALIALLAWNLLLTVPILAGVNRVVQNE